MKHKSTFVGEMIAFSICIKPFKPLGIPSGRVKSREGLPAMIPTNNLLGLCYLISAECYTFKPLNSHMLIP